MDAERAVEKAIAFLEPARTAIDSAELAFVGSLTSERPAQQLIKGQSMLAVAARNLEFCASCILEIAQKLAAESKDATAVDRAAAGSTIPAEQKTGGDRVS